MWEQQLNEHTVSVCRNYLFLYSCYSVPELSYSESTHALSFSKCNLESVIFAPFSVIENAVSSLTMANYLGWLVLCHAWVKSRHCFITVTYRFIRLIRSEAANVLKVLVDNNTKVIFFRILNATDWQNMLLLEGSYMRKSLFLPPKYIQLVFLSNMRHWKIWLLK